MNTAQHASHVAQTHFNPRATKVRRTKSASDGTFATEDNAENGVQMSSIVSHDEDWYLEKEKLARGSIRSSLRDGLRTAYTYRFTLKLLGLGGQVLTIVSAQFNH